MEMVFRESVVSSSCASSLLSCFAQFVSICSLTCLDFYKMSLCSVYVVLKFCCAASHGFRNTVFGVVPLDIHLVRVTASGIEGLTRQARVRYRCHVRDYQVVARVGIASPFRESSPFGALETPESATVASMPTRYLRQGVHLRVWSGRQIITSH